MIQRKTIPFQKLTIDTAQSREPGWDGDEQDERLKESIKNTGILSALLVRPIENTSYEPRSDAEYAIIAGSRRYRAGRKAGKQEFPCKVIEANDLEAAILSFKENEERKELTTEEKAQSIKLQYEALKPIPPEDGRWKCPIDECDCESDSSEGLEMHIQQMHCDDDEQILDVNLNTKLAGGSGVSGAVTNQQAKKILAKKHFPDRFETNNGVQNIDRLIDLTELPSDVRALYKNPDNRTDAEKKKLKQKDIPSDRDLSSGLGDGNRAADAVVALHDELKSVDGVDAAQHTLETVGKLDVGQAEPQLRTRITDIEKDIDEKVTSSESSDEKKEIVTNTIEKHQQNLVEQTDGLDHGLSRQVTFTFDNNKYSVYHSRAREQMKAETHAEAVRKVYQEYLDEQASENDW